MKSRNVHATNEKCHVKSYNCAKSVTQMNRCCKLKIANPLQNPLRKGKLKLNEVKSIVGDNEQKLE